MSDFEKLNLPMSFGRQKRTIWKKETKNDKPKEKSSLFSGINMFVGSIKRKRKTQEEEQVTQQTTQEQEIQQTKQDETPFTGPKLPEENFSQPEESEETQDVFKVPSIPDHQLDLPISNFAVIKGHTKPISALAIDKSGTRLLTGSYDYLVKFWDFGGMNADLKSFRELEPTGAYCINQIAYNCDGKYFAVAPNSSRAKVYDRDGFDQGDFVRGDQYLKDTHHTKGHTAPITGLQWHPTDKDILLSGGHDSTCRLWHGETFTDKNLHVIKAKNKKAMRTKITACQFDALGNKFAAGCEDGSIQIWPYKGPFMRPSMINRDAHPEGTVITSLKFSSDDHYLITRGFDSTLKIFDLRKFTSPVKVFSGLRNRYHQTDCIFSPNEEYILTGTTGYKNEIGEMIFIDRASLNIVKRLNVGNGGVIRILWNERINQIIVGCTDNNTYVYYDPTKSQKGIMLPLKKAPKKKAIDDIESKPFIVAPHALPLFRQEPSRRRQKEKARNDPIRSRKPFKPTGTNTNVTVTSSMSQMMIRKMGIDPNTAVNEDPREAILRYAQEAEKHPKFIASAYKNTQPKPQYDYEALRIEAEMEEKQLLQKKKKRKTSDNMF